MKTLKFAAILLLSAAMLTACRHNRKSSNQTGADSVWKNGKVIGSMSPPDMDTAFVKKAATSGMAEVQMGALAEQKAVSSLVRKFGAMMVRDHSKADKKLEQVAAKNGIAYPGALTNDQMKSLAALRSKSGDDFDKAYISEMIDDHKNDINYFNKAKQTVKDSDLVLFVINTLPILRMHYKAIEDIKNKTGK